MQSCTDVAGQYLIAALFLMKNDNEHTLASRKGETMCVRLHPIQSALRWVNILMPSAIVVADLVQAGAVIIRADDAIAISPVLPKFALHAHPPVLCCHTMGLCCG